MQAFRYLRQAGLMREHVVDGDLFFAELAEFGPVLGYGSLVVDLTPVREDVQAGCREALCRGVGERERAGLPRRAGVLVREPSPDVDNLLAPMIDTDGRADVLVVVELVSQFVADDSECVLHFAV